MLFIIRLLISFLITYYFGRLMFCYFSNSKRNDAISRFHSFFLGLGVTSITFWFYTILTNGYNSYYTLTEISSVILIYLYFRKRNIIKQNQIAISKKYLFKFPNTIELIGFIILILISLVCFLSCLYYPEGAWDAVSMWNFKARFLATGNDSWSGMFSDYYDYIHRDYPLFLPCLLARNYIYVKETSNIIPTFFSCFFTISCFILPYLYLKKLKNIYFAIFSICLLVFSPSIFNECFKQYSDIPLAVFSLISLYELISWERNSNDSSPYLCIIFSSLCFWIKNEGIPWFIMYSIIVLYYMYKKTNSKVDIIKLMIKKTIPLFATVIPVYLSIMSVAYFANNENDLMQGLFSRLGQFYLWNRYYLIIIFAIAFLKKHLWIITIPIFLLLGFIDSQYKKYSLLFVLILMMFSCYFLIYVTTPLDLFNHLKTSFSRIVTSFLPSLVFIGCLLFSFNRCTKK